MVSDFGVSWLDLLYGDKMIGVALGGVIAIVIAIGVLLILAMKLILGLVTFGFYTSPVWGGYLIWRKYYGDAGVSSCGD